MKNPISNDIFGLIYQAFQNLYPGIEMDVQWYPGLTNKSTGERVAGVTVFHGDKPAYIRIDPANTVSNAAEVLAHELAHAAVGWQHEHDKVWEAAFNAIADEYDRLGKQNGTVRSVLDY